MRVDLVLQRLKLHGGGEARLLFERRRGHLGGKQLAEALGDRLLRFGDALGAAVVELERAAHVAAYQKRDDDRGLDRGVLVLGEPDVDVGEQHAGRAVVERRLGGVRSDVAARGVHRFKVARVPEDLRLVGDGDGDGGGRRQKQLADFLRRVAIQALLHAFERAAGQAQHRVGLARADRVGVHRQADEQHDRQREHHACRDHDGNAVRGGDGSP